MAKKKGPPESSTEYGRWVARVMETIQKESDRGCVLVAAALLDEALELLLREQMSSDQDIVKNSINPLLTGIGPLTSFWAKTSLCHSLRLISPSEHADLTRIRTLRNLFAHGYENASFEEPHVVDIIRGLNGPEEAWLRPEMHESRHPRHRFTVAAAMLSAALNNKVLLKQP